MIETKVTLVRVTFVLPYVYTKGGKKANNLSWF